MLAWHAWLLAGLILLLLELLTLSFFALAFGLAALVTMVAAWLGLDLTLQWLVFALTSLMLAPVLKRLFRRFAPSRRRHSLAGEGEQQLGEVLQLASGEYRVKFDGDTYLVRSRSGRALIAGTQVNISRFDGITAIID